MNYVDADIINEKTPKTTYTAAIGPSGISSGNFYVASGTANYSSSTKYSLTMSAMLKYVKSTNKFDFFLPFEDYVDLISSIGVSDTGARDDKDRPTFLYFGIRFTALSKEDSDKYKVLK